VLPVGESKPERIVKKVFVRIVSMDGFDSELLDVIDRVVKVRDDFLARN